MKDLTFDSIFRELSLKIPYFGKSIAIYYAKHTWFKRFSKFATSTFLMYWVVKGPLIWMLTALTPPLNLFLFVIPNYVVAAFFAGIIGAIISFVLNELWVWKHESK